MLEYIHSHPQESERLLGIKYEDLEKLLKQAEQLHNNKQQIATAKKVRIIASGGGRPPKLSISEQIILTLTYLRHLTTFQLLGIQFGVSETTANDIFNYWCPIIGELLPPSLLEQVKKTQVTKKLLRKF
jgi:hypothetical protein